MKPMFSVQQIDTTAELVLDQSDNNGHNATFRDWLSPVTLTTDFMCLKDDTQMWTRPTNDSLLPP